MAAARGETWTHSNRDRENDIPNAPFCEPRRTIFGDCGFGSPFGSSWPAGYEFELRGTAASGRPAIKTACAEAKKIDLSNYQAIIWQHRRKSCSQKIEQEDGAIQSSS
ncbi:MAG TPA: hypothetical protein P5114_05125 [Hyphomicrobiaceae bacterium]|nr:hypothetical protein [Hyphomicrobiaceae bacterium]